MMHAEMNLPSPSSTVMEDFSGRQVKSARKKKDLTGDSLVVAQSIEKVSDTTAIPSASPDFNDVPTKGRRGHLFCGCLCDMRRAVIGVNIASIVIAIVEICFLIAFLALYEEIMANADTTGTTEWFSVNESISKGILGTSLGFCVVSLVFYSIGIHGAKTFNSCMVITALIYHCISAVFNLIALNILGMLLSILFVYPHVLLMMEIRNGSMNEQNYINEKKGCCV